MTEDLERSWQFKKIVSSIRNQVRYISETHIFLLALSRQFFHGNLSPKMDFSSVDISQSGTVSHQCTLPQIRGSQILQIYSKDFVIHLSLSPNETFITIFFVSIFHIFISILYCFFFEIVCREIFSINFSMCSMAQLHQKT